MTSNMLTPEEKAESHRKYLKTIKAELEMLKPFREVVLTAIRWRKLFHTEVDRMEDDGILCIIDTIYKKNPTGWKQELATIEQNALRYPTLAQRHAYLATIQLPIQIKYYKQRVSKPDLLKECLATSAENQEIANKILAEGPLRNKGPPLNNHVFDESARPEWEHFANPRMAIYREAFPEEADDSHLKRIKLVAQKYELVVQAQQKFPVWFASNVYEQKYKEPLEILLGIVQEEVQLGDEILGATKEQKTIANAELEALARRQQIVFNILPMPPSDAELCKLLRDVQYVEPSRAHYAVLKKCIDDTVKEYSRKEGK